MESTWLCGEAIHLLLWSLMQRQHPQECVVMGIDPGISTTGYGVLHRGKLIHHGKVSTSPKLQEPLRYLQIHRALLEVMRTYGVEQVALEHFYAFYVSDDKGGSGSGNSALAQILSNDSKRRFRHDRQKINPKDIYKMKGAQTVAQMAALEHGAGIALYTVDEWKGNGKLSKEAIRERVRLFYKTDIRNNNITDAIMIASFHVNHGWMKPGRLILPADLDEPVKKKPSPSPVVPLPNAR